MDDYRAFRSDGDLDWDFPSVDEPCMDVPPMIGTDERRMHVRAYEMWLSLLDGRSYPAIADLDASSLGEFGPYSVLLDFSADPANPVVAFLGRALREEGGLSADIATVADVPQRSLLSRLTDHYAEILENRAPVGFEAEFVSHHNRPTMYRGILMPYSSDGDTIGLVHGVINWKETANADLPADIVEAVAIAFTGPAQPAEEAVAIALDGEDAFDFGALTIDELVEDARELALEAGQAESRGHAALYRAISVAYDVALAADADPAGFGRLLAAAGVVAQERAPMTPVIKLVFGPDYDRKRVSEYATVLRHARRLCLASGTLESWLRSVEGGIKAVVASERGERRPALKVDRVLSARMLLQSLPPRATVDIGAIEGDLVLLVARREADGRVAIVSRPIADRALIDRALKRFAA